MKSLQGHLLVASPQLLDPNFAKTIVLMVEHNEDGALGLILNRSTDVTIGQVWKQVSKTSCERHDPLHHGGPCEGPLMILHMHKSASEVEISSGIYFSSEKDHVEWLLEQHDDPIKFFVGCAGWAPGQLESELATDSWLTVAATTNEIFNGSEDQWGTVTRQIMCSTAYPSLNPRIVPEDPSMN